MDKAAGPYSAEETAVVRRRYSSSEMTSSSTDGADGEGTGSSGIGEALQSGWQHRSESLADGCGGGLRMILERCPEEDEEDSKVVNRHANQLMRCQ